MTASIPLTADMTASIPTSCCWHDSQYFYLLLLTWQLVFLPITVDITSSIPTSYCYMTASIPTFPTSYSWHDS